MSALIARATQFGQSMTATQNFTLAVPSPQDGTIKLARGNVGSTTADVFSVDASGVVTFTQPPLLVGGNPVGSLVGSIVAWPTSTVPSGYLHCNGASISTATYSALHGVIGYNYGGAGASFSLPDYRGYFLRGWDNGRGLDPDSATRTDRGDGTTGDNVGTKQADEFKSHTGHGGGNWTVPSGTSQAVQINNPVSFGGNETRPVNIYVMWIIKF